MTKRGGRTSVARYWRAMMKRCKCKARIVGGWIGDPTRGKPLYAEVSTFHTFRGFPTHETHTARVCVGGHQVIAE